jgi:transposase-like protein
MAQKSFFILVCPTCKGENSLRNSRPRNLKEKIIQSLPFIEIYRCKKCGWRSWKFNYTISSRGLKKILLYILLMILASFIVYNILKLVV